MISFTVNSTTDLLSLRLTLLPYCTSTPATVPIMYTPVPSYLSSLTFRYRQVDYNSNSSPTALVVPTHIDIIHPPSSKEKPVHPISLTGIFRPDTLPTWPSTFKV